LAGDGSRFTKTFVGLNQLPAEGIIVAIGFYGHQLQESHGSYGGWDEFMEKYLRLMPAATANCIIKP
jgi:hypothetical protein